MMPSHRIEGEIGWEATAGGLASFLAANRGRPVEIVFNSPGGLATEGAAMKAELEKHGRAIGIVRGISASAASLALMGCDRIVMHPDAFLMIHEPSAGTWGAADDHRKAAEVLDLMTGVYADGYARRAKMDKEKALELMAAETWMDAEMAVDLGFADMIEAEGSTQLLVARFDYAGRFRHAPAALIAMAREKGWATRSPEHGKGDCALLDDKSKTGQEPEQPTLTQAQMRRERSRVKRIIDATAAASLPADFGDKLIEDGVDLETALDRITAAWKEQGDVDRPSMGRATVGRSWDSPEGQRAKAIDAFEARLDPKHKPTIGQSLGRVTIEDLAMSSATALGMRPFNVIEAVRMAASHTTSDFPLILEGALGNTMARQLGQRQPALMRAAMEIPAEDYRQARTLKLSAPKDSKSAATGIREVAEGGEVTSFTMDESGELKPVPRDFAGIFNLSNKAIVNDSTAVGLLQEASGRMVQGCVEMMRNVLLAPLLANSGAGQNMADGQPVFTTGRGNLASTGGACDVTTVGAARAALRKMKGPAGELYAIEPWALVVSAERETVAQQFVAQINATKLSDANPFSGQLEVIVEPGLGTSVGWYLIGNPAVFDGLAYSYLDGQSSPRVESRAGWETLGMEFRVTMSFDARFVEAVTWYRNPGA
jgi:ATP-dependent protease ClpP protease subunit